MKKIQLFLKYLVLMLFLTVWIIIMFFTDYMNSQSVKLYCMFVVDERVIIRTKLEKPSKIKGLALI